MAASTLEASRCRAPGAAPRVCAATCAGPPTGARVTTTPGIPASPGSATPLPLASLITDPLITPLATGGGSEPDDVPVGGVVTGGAAATGSTDDEVEDDDRAPVDVVTVVVDEVDVELVDVDAVVVDDVEVDVDEAAGDGLAVDLGPPATPEGVLDEPK